MAIKSLREVQSIIEQEQMVADVAKKLRESENRIRSQRIATEYIIEALKILNGTTEEKILDAMRDGKKEVYLSPLIDFQLHSVIEDERFNPFIKELEEAGYNVETIKSDYWDYYDSESVNKTHFYNAGFKVSWA